MRINNLLTDWFDCSSGVRQGDVLSTGNDTVSILMYADDIALLAENETDLQYMINYLNQWCQTRVMKVNVEKTKTMHFRPKRQHRTQFKFM